MVDMTRRIYSFAKISASGQLTEADYSNKHIITEDLKVIINVSDKYHIKRTQLFRSKGIHVYNLELIVRIPAQCRPGSPVILGHLC